MVDSGLFSAHSTSIIHETGQVGGQDWLLLSFNGLGGKWVGLVVIIKK